ncbi:MAG: hypothetical protein ACD_79C00916G0001 [uncultured bacterium]|nr:MAG: hypothetical protein ACD_79C00916G0001 [uncultured bacterium]
MPFPHSPTPPCHDPDALPLPIKMFATSTVCPCPAETPPEPELNTTALLMAVFKTAPFPSNEKPVPLEFIAMQPKAFT